MRRTQNCACTKYKPVRRRDSSGLLLSYVHYDHLQGEQINCGKWVSVSFTPNFGFPGVADIWEPQVLWHVTLCLRGKGHLRTPDTQV